MSIELCCSPLLDSGQSTVAERFVIGLPVKNCGVCGYWRIYQHTGSTKKMRISGHAIHVTEINHVARSYMQLFWLYEMRHHGDQMPVD